MISISACASTYIDINLKDLNRIVWKRGETRGKCFCNSFLGATNNASQTDRPGSPVCVGFAAASYWLWLATMTVLSFDFRRNHPHSVAMIDPTNPRIWKDAAVAGVLFAVVWVLDAILGLLMGV